MLTDVYRSHVLVYRLSYSVNKNSRVKWIKSKIAETELMAALLYRIGFGVYLHNREQKESWRWGLKCTVIL